jgi:hypothetical protein
MVARQRPPTPHFCKLATFFVAGPVRIRTCGVDRVCKPAFFFCKLDFFAKWNATSAVLSSRGFWRAPTSVVAIARNFYPPQKSGSPMRPFLERALEPRPPLICLQAVGVGAVVNCWTAGLGDDLVDLALVAGPDDASIGKTAAIVI